MSKSLLYWLLLVLWFIVGWWLCKNYLCGASDNIPTTAAAVAPIIAAKDKCDGSLRINDGTEFSSQADQNVRFLRSEFSNLPISARTESSLKDAARYLSNNTGRTLMITGNYDRDESYTGILPNLGVARATTVKNLLVGFGAPANQIDIQGLADAESCFIEDSRSAAQLSAAGNADDSGTSGGAGASGLRKDTLSNGLGFSFTDKNDNANRLADIKSRLLGKSIILYFDTNSDRISVTNQQRQDFADISFYLDNVPNTGLTVDGHTDNRGETNYNRRLSRNRAQTVRDYIVKNAGINSNRLSSQGLGETKPISTNDTPEGRAQNRRVEVILLQE